MCGGVFASRGFLLFSCSLAGSNFPQASLEPWLCFLLLAGNIHVQVLPVKLMQIC